jgi:hypothetical protein
MIMYELGLIRKQVTTYLHRLVRRPGCYADKPSSRESALFGSVDAAMVRCIMGETLLETVPLTERQAWADFINSHQEETGEYRGGLSHSYHTNGNAVSALAVLGMQHRYCTWPLYAPFATINLLNDWLARTIDWKNAQWRDSQRFRGGPHMFYYSRWATDSWREALLKWLDANLDPDTGRWCKGAIAQTLEQHIGGASHIWPIYEHTGHPFPYPEKVLDAIIELAGGRKAFSNCGSFLNVDALYGIKMMRKQVPAYREHDISLFLDTHTQWLFSQLDAFWVSEPGIHQVLGLCDSCGVLYQLGVCGDDVEWTDHFSNTAFYNSASVINCATE